MTRLKNIDRKSLPMADMELSDEDLARLLDDSAFSGNPNLRPANTKAPMTEDQQLEFFKCAEDPIYFIKTYVKIVNLDEGLINFRLYGFQENMVRQFVKNRFTICKMPRQVGKTTTTAAVILWHIMFNKQFTAAILANKMEQAQEIMSRIQLSYESLPKWMQHGVLSWNKRFFALENGSKVISAATSSSAIRGRSISLLYLDEFAHVDANMQEEFFASVYPTIASGKKTKVIITSTPKGYEMFARMWVEAEEGRNSYVPVSVHWSDVPGRDEAWRRETISNTSEELFRQEHECEFLGSSNTLISVNALRNLRHVSAITKTDDIVIFEAPQKGKSYMITVDTSRGTGGDFSAFLVIDISAVPYKVVARYKNNTVPVQLYPNYIYRAAKAYNDAYVLVETNDLGQQVADILHQELETDNVLTTTFMGRGGQRLGGFGANARLGVKTSVATKRIGCAQLKVLVEENKVELNDMEIIGELIHFVSNGTSYEAESGYHDDLAMCLVLFAWASVQEFFHEIANNNVRNIMLSERERQMEDEMLPFGFIADGHDQHQDYNVATNMSAHDFDQFLSSW